MAKEYIDKEKFKHLFRGTKDTCLDDDHKEVIDTVVQKATTKGYINREVVLSYLNRQKGTPPERCYSHFLYCLIEDFIKHIPSADVVEVVWCCNCIHLKIDSIDRIPYCEIHSTKLDKFYVRTDDYCSYGERKE